MLTAFFRINMPYGMRRNSGNEWQVFNAEYLPLGCSNSHADHQIMNKAPLYIKYRGLTEAIILEIINRPDQILREGGEIARVYFYNDATNPHSNHSYWNDYFNILKMFSRFCTYDSH